MNIALILSGGTGRRMGLDRPKQYIEVCGRPIISYCMERLFAHDEIDAVQIVAEEMWRNKILEAIKQLAETAGSRVLKKFRGFSTPGANRQLSILQGLEDIGKYADDSDYVFIHDAARPLLSGQQITDCLNAAKGHDGVIPVLLMKDTVYSSKDGLTITSLLNRSQIFAGQAPEVFKFGPYYEANRKLLPDDILLINGSTEPAVMDGLDVFMIPGNEENFKITTRMDLERFRKIMESDGMEKGKENADESMGLT